MKKIIGALIILLLFALVIRFMIGELGFIDTLKIVCTTVGLAALIIIGVFLLIS